MGCFLGQPNNSHMAETIQGRLWDEKERLFSEIILLFRNMLLRKFIVI